MAERQREAARSPTAPAGQRLAARDAAAPDPRPSSSTCAPALAWGNAPVPARPEPGGELAPALPALPLPERGEPIVTGAILPGAAHLRLGVDGVGDVLLHVRIREGAAHVRLEADPALGLAGRAAELARALARDGIALAGLEVEPRNAPAPPPTGLPARADAETDGRSRRGGRGSDEADEPTARGAPPRRRRLRGAGRHDVSA